MNAKEKDTVRKMIYLYCNAKHNTKFDLCETCLKLNKYAQNRLTKCVYGDHKPTCQKCRIHCYSPTMKVKIREVMRYAGPKMFLHNPFIAIVHLARELNVRSRKKYLE